MSAALLSRGCGVVQGAQSKSHLHTGDVQLGHAAGAATPHVLISAAVCAQPFCFPKGTCGKHESSCRDTGDDPEPDARDSLCVPGCGPEQARPWGELGTTQGGNAARG